MSLSSSLERARPRRSLRATQIPWGYGVNRVTAAAVDPDRLFVCWEITDGAIAKASAALWRDRDVRDAEMCLRVYDTTSRLFDGSNAHHHFDQRVQRGDCQWFFTIGRASSSAVVELGVRSVDGRFARIVRSKRVDFPRKRAASWRGPEWLTVRATGEVERSKPPTPPHEAPPLLHHESPRSGDPPWFTPIPLWVLRDVREVGVHRESWETVWQSSDGAGWLEPVSMTTWMSGPFSHPVEVEQPSSQSWQGGSTSYRVGGVTHVVDGPWHVVIRNLGAKHERTVLSRWEVARSWVVSGGRERSVGAPEQVVFGGSEHAWLAGSEMRLGGASERFWLGASETRFGGASERLYAGASQWMMLGASERRMLGASESRLGASERRLARTYSE
jgi:hypothetical protein